MKNKKDIIISSVLLSATSISVFWIIWLSLTPIIDRDATRFHLPFAKLWAEHSFLYFRPYFAYYDLNMLNLNYLYMLVFKFGLSDQFTKVIHASFLIAGGYLIFKYFKEKYGFNWGALSFILYVTIPIHQRLAAEVYVDLGLLFFSTLAIIYFIKWFESDFQKRTYLIISSIGAGLGFGTKYNGMIIAFFLVLFTGLVISREKKDDKLAFKSMIIFGFTILLCITPWIFRNIIDSRNPFFPLFLNVFHSTINMPAELIENVNGETINRIINGGDSIFSLFLLPLRVFFEGADHDFLKFDGVLNPFLILILPFIFYPKFTDLNKKKIVFYLFFMFTIVYLVTLYSNNIRVRYFIPILPILIILNIEALKNIYNSKNFYPLFYLFSACFIIYNINYGIFLSNNLNLLELNPFSIRSKEIYLKNHLVNYDFIEYINNNTPESSVIYEALTGGRSYYINRSFYCDTASIDRYLLELAEKGAESDEYKKHFENLPNSNLSATHLLIRANGLAQTFININRNEKDPESTENVNKLQGYFQFLNELKLLKKEDGVYLFEL